MLSEQVEAWTPSTEEEKAAVLEQLERLLQNSHFHRSKRFPVFLKFVVHEVLAGRMDSLKERTLGIEVFGKHPDYDTTDDPIVRVTAGEIRKRIAQYYQEPGHEHEIKLLLPAGSYIPQFYLPGQFPGAAAAESKDDSGSTRIGDTSGAPLERRGLAGWKILAGAAALLLLVASAILWRWAYPDPLQEFWAPFIKSPDPVLFCIADQSQYSTLALRDAADPKRVTTLNDHMITVIIDDLSPLVNIAGLLQSNGKTYRVQGETVTTLTDLRRGPSVFIGAFDNSWTLRFTAPLRYHFANNPQMTSFWIEDQQNPAKRDWLLERSQQDTGTYKDYAIVARLLDSNTGRFVIIAAGVARGGTVAAGEFLVEPEHMNELADRAPKDWNRKNVEIVLETQVIEGRSGPPRIDAVYVW
jgi:hypothetical protein